MACASYGFSAKLCKLYADIGNSTGSRHPGQRLSRDEKTYRAALSATNAACTSSRNAFEIHAAGILVSVHLALSLSFPPTAIPHPLARNQ
jgi:hypothetical protein